MKTNLLISFLFLFGCGSKNRDICKSDIIAFDEKLNFRLNDCVDLETLQETNGKFGQYTLFNVECDDNYATPFVFTAISFDLKHNSNRRTSNIRIAFLNYGMDKDEYYDYCQFRLEGIFGCNKSLLPISNNIHKLEVYKSFEMDYKNIKFRLWLESEDMIVLGLSKV